MAEFKIVSNNPGVDPVELVEAQFGEGSALVDIDKETRETLKADAASLVRSGYERELVNVAIGTLAQLRDEFVSESDDSVRSLSRFPSLMQIADYQKVYGDPDPVMVEHELVDQITSATQAKASKIEDDHESVAITPRQVVEYALALNRSGQIEAFLANSEETDAGTPYEALMFAIQQRREIEVVDVKAPVSSGSSAQSGPSKSEAPVRPYSGVSTAIAVIEDVDPTVRQAIGLPASKLRNAIQQYGLSHKDIEDLSAATDGTGVSAEAALALYERGHSPASVALAVAVDSQLSGSSEQGPSRSVRIRELHEGNRMTDSERELFESDAGVIDMALYQEFVDYFGFHADDPSVDSDISEAISWAVEKFGRGGAKANVERALKRCLKAADGLRVTTFDRFVKRVEGAEDDFVAESED